MGILKSSGVSFKKATSTGMLRYVMASASISVSEVISKAIRKQKSVSSDMDSSTGPHNTGIIKKMGSIHRIKRIALGFIKYTYDVTEKAVKCQ